MDALMNTVAFQAMQLKSDTLEQVYSARLQKEAMNMDAQMAMKEIDMLPQVPKGEYIDVYA